jgi:hypothetical protein
MPVRVVGDQGLQQPRCRDGPAAAQMRHAAAAISGLYGETGAGEGIRTLDPNLGKENSVGVAKDREVPSLHAAPDIS